MFQKSLKYLFLTAILVFAELSYGQKISSEVYKDRLNKVKEASEIKDIQQSIKSLEEINLLAELEKDTVNYLFSMHFIARKSQFINETYKSIKLFNKELSVLRSIESDSIKKTITKDANRVQETEILLQLGNNFAQLGDAKIALDYFYQGLELSKKNKSEFYSAVIPILIGDMERTAKNYLKSLQLYKQGVEALQNSKTINERNVRFNSALTYVSMSESYLGLQKNDSATIILKEIDKRDLNDVNSVVDLMIELQKAKVLIANKNYQDALQRLRKVKRIAEIHNPKNPDTYYYKELSNAYNKLGKTDSAIIILEKGINVAKLNTKDFFLANDYKSLAKLYKKAGNLEKSNQYYEKYVLNQSALDKSKQDIINMFHSKELENLASEKEKQQKTSSYLMLGGSVVIALLLLYLFSLSKKRKKETQKFETLLTKVSSSDMSSEIKIVDTKEQLKKDKLSDITEETTQQILDGLQKLEQQEYYLKQECNSYNVAKKIKTNTSYLSKVINAKFDKNFNTYINDLRINYALVKLKEDTRFRSYSVKSIAEELGYKSADSFSKYFKIRTGLQPSVYIKKLNELT